MEEKSANNYFPTVGDGSGLAQSDALYKEELQLALRNRGMPLEALRYPITPTGLHYLLIHYDIPAVDADGWRLKIAGRVATPLELTLEEIKKRPRQTIPVTMECAGNGRALFAPRRISQPWLLEAIGTAEWTGTPLRTTPAGSRRRRRCRGNCFYRFGSRLRRRSGATLPAQSDRRRSDQNRGFAGL